MPEWPAGQLIELLEEATGGEMVALVERHPRGTPLLSAARFEAANMLP